MGKMTGNQLEALSNQRKVRRFVQQS